MIQLLPLSGENIQSEFLCKVRFVSAVKFGLQLFSECSMMFISKIQKGELINETTGESKTFEPFKDFMLEILEDGGLVNHYLNDKE